MALMQARIWKKQEKLIRMVFMLMREERLLFTTVL